MDKADTEDRCPSCGVDLTGDPIPEESRHFYGSHTHFSRRIGIYDFERDRTTHWECPDCGHVWPRAKGEG